MKKLLQIKTLKRGTASALILLFTILLIHSCKQEHLQPEQIKHITVDRNKAAGLKSNLQKSTKQNTGTCYYEVFGANGDVHGTPGPLSIWYMII